MTKVSLSRLSLTYRHRNRLLLFGGIAFCWVVYALSIRQTVELYQQNQQLTRQLENARTAPATIRQLEKQLEAYEKVLKHSDNDTLQREEYLLDKITTTCRRNHVRLMSLPVSQVAIQDNFETKTRIIKLKGGFIDLLRVVHDAEYQFPIGRISSVRFAMEENRESSALGRAPADLFVYLYIQNLSIPHEKD